MSKFSLTIDGHAVSVTPGQTVLEASRALGLEIPTLCHLQQCGPLNSCLVCLVKINGKLVPACGTPAQPGMAVESETDEVHLARRTALELLFSDHVGDCLSPCQRLCPLRMNIPVMIRHLQNGNLEAALSTVRESLPLPAVLGRLCHHPCEQGCRRSTADEPAGIRDMERFVADWDLRRAAGEAESVASAIVSPPLPHPEKKPASGKSVVIIGAGPAGLAAAHHLRRAGHACTIANRNLAAGGTLRSQAPESALPRTVLDAEIRQLERSGVQFRFGSALGRDLTLDGLLLGFDAVLLTVGEISKAEGEALDLEMAPGGIRIEPDTFLTNRHAVFAAGRAVRPLNRILRAMTDGQAAAELIHRFLLARPLERPRKPFSSIMGRLDQDELKIFLDSSSPARAHSPCDTCVGLDPKEAASEATRCLRCDCRSSGHCALQTYAELYGADASRFRQQRRRFEQYAQPSGVIFEPGKCILCGICVKLTEMAGEPLGLTFIGRGFDVRVAAPFDHVIQDGLQRIAADCVRHCPTGALTFKEGKQE